MRIFSLPGFVPEDLIVAAKPDYHISHFRELPPIVKKLLHLAKIDLDIDQ